MFRTQFRILSTLASLLALGLMDTTGAPGTGGTGSGGTGSGGTGGTGGDPKDADKDGDDDGTGWDGPLDKERAKRALLASRERENTAIREAREAKEQTAKVLAALGLNPDGSQDPAKLLEAANKKAEDAAARAKAKDIELAVFKTAADPKIAANAAKLLDSRSFMAEVDKLNPDGRDFEDKVKEAIKAAVKADPTLASAGVTPPKPTPPNASTASNSFGGGGGTAAGEPRTAHERVMRAYAANSQST